MKRHIAFIHQNYPAQFGPISRFLAEECGVDVSFFSQYLTQPVHPRIRHFPYHPVTTGHEETPYFFARHFEESVASMHGVLNAVQQAKIEPDVFIGHAAFGTLGLLHGAYPDIPKIGFFEYFYHQNPAMSDSRPEFPPPWPNWIRIPLRNAVQLTELEYCLRGYSPTPFQRSTYPQTYQPRIEVLFDGIDTSRYRPGEVSSMSPLKRTWPSQVPIVTYVSRGLEAMRGFDMFMRIAHEVSKRHPEVHFVIAGLDKTHYGSEALHLQGESFREYVLKQQPYDLSRFHFVGWLPEDALADLFRLSACHVYWTVPFTLSWSFFQAMASGVCMLASDTAPVRDVLKEGENGYRLPPYDIQAWVERILAILESPASTQSLRHAARQTAVSHYSLDVCLPKLADFLLAEKPSAPIERSSLHVGV